MLSTLQLTILAIHGSSGILIPIFLELGTRTLPGVLMCFGIWFGTLMYILYNNRKSIRSQLFLNLAIDCLLYTTTVFPASGFKHSPGAVPFIISFGMLFSNELALKWADLKEGILDWRRGAPGTLDRRERGERRQRQPHQMV